MVSGRFPEGLENRLASISGLSLSQESVGGPMGSASWRFSNGVVDIEIYSDRGRLGAAAGVARGVTFESKVWARVLNIQLHHATNFEMQIDFLLDHIADIQRAVESEPNIEARVRETNWVFVKERLGLDPQMDPPHAADT